MKNSKNLYIEPSFEIIEASKEDVISTSGFDGKEQSFDTNSIITYNLLNVTILPLEPNDNFEF